MKYELAPENTMHLMDWDSAVMYCMFLNVGNKQDWRLPNIPELLSLDLPNDTIIWTNMINPEDGRMLFSYDTADGKRWWNVHKDNKANVWAIRTK